MKTSQKRFRSDNNPVVIKHLQQQIIEYKKNANTVAKLLQEVENQRTRIINHIEEAEYNGLNRRAVNKLEDKLERPYAISLLAFNR